jgi:uncharacterized protein (TIGR02145 family)
MKRILYAALTFITFFTACSKKNDANPDSNTSSNTVTISGTKYSTVVIGDQTWTSVNYNGPGGVDYNSSPNNSTYGKLYTFAEAKGIALPAGWRLPTKDDFNNFPPLVGGVLLNGGVYLVTGNGPLKLMSKTGWTSMNGTNDLGFNAFPAGFYNEDKPEQFSELGVSAVFISSTLSVEGGTNPDAFVIGPTVAQLTDGIFLYPEDRASVRFVKDN